MLLINNFPSFKINKNVTSDQFQYYAGGNIGNSWIADAIRAILPIREGVSNIFRDELHMHYDNSHIIINAQDWIKPNIDYNVTHEFWLKLKNFIIKSKKPVVILGLGINQLANNETLADFKKRIDKHIIECLLTISEHANLISVRGEFTADFLEMIGIKNAYVTGCPTLLVKSKLNFKKINKKDPKFAINCAYINSLNKNNSFFVQDEEFFLKLLFEGGFDRKIARAYKGMSLAWYSQFMNCIRQKKIFLLPNFFAAIKNYKKYDFTVGTRLHGGLASIAAGIPTIITNPDIRARETTNAMGIPYFPELCNWENSYFGDSHNILEIFDTINWKEVEEKHKKYRSNFIYFFEKNNISLRSNTARKIKSYLMSYQEILTLKN